MLREAWRRAALADGRLARRRRRRASVGPEQVRNSYAAADVLVIPSIATRHFLEPWGLVANEAMNQHLPVIATDAVGAAAGGLVRHERNGLVVPAGDPDALAAALCAGCTTTPRCARGSAPTGPRDVAAYTHVAWAEGFADALRGATGRTDPLLASRTQPGRENAAAPARCHRAMRRLLTALTILLPRRARRRERRQRLTKLLRDACRDEHVDGTYTQAEYKQALDQLPTDSDEYTGCREVLQRARLAALGAGKHRSTGGGGATGAAARPAARAARAPRAAPRARRGVARRPAPTRWPPPRPSSARPLAQAGKSAKPVDVGGELVQPGALGLGELSGAGRDVPTPLIALICLLAATALGAGGWWLWSRVLARRFG